MRKWTTYGVAALALFLILGASTTAGAEPPVSGTTGGFDARVGALEPTIGAFPPRLADDAEKQRVESEYQMLKTELDAAVQHEPGNLDLLYERGRLQAMGHNLDLPGAFEGGVADLKGVLERDPSHVPAILELGELWVNADPKWAPRAELLFRGAQCHAGSMPLERAQAGLFFAFYYQGRIDEAVREADFLVATWPNVERYRRLRDVSHAVRDRRGHASPADPAVPVMASCDTHAP